MAMKDFDEGSTVHNPMHDLKIIMDAFRWGSIVVKAILVVIAITLKARDHFNGDSINSGVSVAVFEKLIERRN